MFDLLQQLTQITSGRRGQKLLREIGLMGSYWAKQSDEQLHRASLSLRYRAQCGEPLESLLSAAYSLVRTASDRVLGMRHYDTQVLAGIVLQQRAIAEMQTGEGKTLTAMLPAYLHSLRGQGVHLATANDYLAVRDSTLVRPVMELLGMSVGVVDSTTPRSQRALAYRCDITYGTAREFGFDFLRDQMLHPARQASRPGWVAGWLGSQSQTDRRVQRELNFTIVDEADCILIDEARTPLVLATSRATDEQVRCAFQWSASVASQFEPETHFEFDPSGTQISLTSDGRTLARKLLPPGDIPDMGLFEVYEYVERAIQAWRLFQRDRHYVVRKNEVVIVDEFTGRLSEGRQWRDGLHQAMEAKECLPIHVMTGELARISLQSFFR